MASKRKAEPEAVSAFEARRRNNITTNQELLKDVAVTAQRIIPAPRPKTAPKPRSRISRAPVVRVAAQPSRASARLRGDHAKAAEVIGTKDLVETSDADRPAKRTRVADDLKLGDITVEGKKFANSAADLALLLPTRGADPGVRTFDYEEVKREVDDNNLKDALKSMNKLELYDRWEVNDIKITPQRVYAMSFHPTEDKKLVFAGDKQGNMGIFDASQEVPTLEDDNDDDEGADVPDPVIMAFKTHTRTITGFYFPPQQPSSVFTSSHDSTIRRLDLGTGTPTSVQVWAPEDVDDEACLTSIDGPASDPHLIVFATLNGALGRYDTRTPAKDAELWQVCDAKIGGFSLNPRTPHLVATASLDRTLKIWDLRKIVGKGNMRHPRLVGEHLSRLSVSHASWSSAGQIATSSYDDTIKIHDFGDASSWSATYDLSEKAMEPAHVIRHNNQTGRWVTILKPLWQKHPQDGVQKFAIGNMNRFVDVYASDGSQLAQLGGEGITAVPAVAQLHPTKNWVVGGTSSGKVCLWL